MIQEITRTSINKILQSENLSVLDCEKMVGFFREEKEIKNYISDGIFQIDPRNGDRIVYNSARAKRPHDNSPKDFEGRFSISEGDCLICQGKTTGVLDIAELSEGFTFINKNLFPIVFPFIPIGTELGMSRKKAYGMHFLQWTSSLHDRDWHNMPQEDRIIVLKRIAALEKKLLACKFDFTENIPKMVEANHDQGFVSVIKNFGRLVGGSLEHGHQQIGFSTVMPNRVEKNLKFENHYKVTFSTYLLRNSPHSLLLKDYGSANLIIPYFMRRPYDMMLVLKNSDKKYIYELNSAEIAAVSEGWHDAIRAILKIMPQIGRETAYNVVANTGPGCGIYFEFLPYTQELGGFEHLGLFLCQGNPKMCADHIKSILD